MEYILYFFTFGRSRLVAPRTYLSASQEEKSKYTNGAGAYGCAWLVPDTMFGLNVSEAANIHDWMYCEGTEFEQKLMADRIFLFNLISIIDSNTTKVFLFGFILRMLRRKRAFIYYLAVVLLGWRAFKNASFKGD